MPYTSTHRHVRISARKVRPLADMIRGKFADEALAILKYQPQRGAQILYKVLRSAIGNAQDPEQNKEQKKGRSIAIDQLVITDVRIDGGPMFKRVRPRARGMAFMVLRRTAHVQVTVEDINEIGGE